MSSTSLVGALVPGLILAVLATCGHAQTPSASPPAPARGATPLEGLTVAPSPPASVVSSFPAAGASIDPGVLVLKIRFDQSMDPDTWSYAKGADGEYPDCLAKPRLLADARTFVLLCTTAPGKRYAVLLNGGEGAAFANPGGRKAGPFELQFSTGLRPLVSSLKEAMTAAGLRDEDSPILNAEPARP